MTPYTVTWVSEALADLAAIWVAAADRAAVTAAETQIHHLLVRDPAGVGYHISESLYRLQVPPLTVYYGVDEVAQSVEVAQVRYTP